MSRRQRTGMVLSGGGATGAYEVGVLEALAAGASLARKPPIHTYRPGTGIGGGSGVLDFDAERLPQLIELGYRDAASHDCAVAGCVVTG